MAISRAQMPSQLRGNRMEEKGGSARWLSLVLKCLVN